MISNKKVSLLGYLALGLINYHLFLHCFEKYHVTFVGVIFLAFLILFAFEILSCLFKSIIECAVYRASGVGGTPIVCYPIIFGSNIRNAVTLFWSFFHVGVLLYPKSMYTRNISEKEKSRVILRVTISGIATRVFYALSAAVMFVVNGFYLLAVAALIMGIFWLAVEVTGRKHDYTLGTKLSLLKEGKCDLFLMRSAELFKYDNPDLLLNGLKEFSSSNNNDLCVEIKYLFNLLFLMCIKDNENFISVYEQLDIEKYLPNNSELSWDVELIGAKNDFLKVCTYYTLVSGNKRHWKALSSSLTDTGVIADASFFKKRIDIYEKCRKLFFGIESYDGFRLFDNNGFECSFQGYIENIGILKAKLSKQTNNS